MALMLRRAQRLGIARAGDPVQEKGARVVSPAVQMLLACDGVSFAPSLPSRLLKELGDLGERHLRVEFGRLSGVHIPDSSEPQCVHLTQCGAVSRHRGRQFGGAGERVNVQGLGAFGLRSLCLQ